MKRIALAVALLAACSLGIAASYAGPACCGSKKDGKGEAMAKAKAACSSLAVSCSAKPESCTGDFPALVRMVGDKTVECPMTAEKLAKEQNAKVVYMLGDRKFECQESAMQALADAAEEYNKNYTRIVLVADGKAYVCGDDCCKDKPCMPVALSSAADSCCETKSVAYSARAKSSCGSTATVAASSCSGKSGSEAKTASAGSCGSKASAVKVADHGHGGGSSGKASCSGKGEGEVKTAAATDGEKTSCGSKKDGEVKTVAATGEKSGSCSGAKTAATGSSKKDGEVKTVAATDGEKASCGAKKDGEVRVAKVEGGSCGSKGAAKATLASGEGSGCSKGGAKVALASGEGDKACCASKKASLVKADKNCMELVKSAKEVKFCVAGQQFKDYKEAAAFRDRIVAATSKVNMKYIVDGKEVSCSSQVCPSAKQAGKVKYVVGKDEMGCEVMARIAVAKARYEAARTVASEKMAKM